MWWVKVTQPLPLGTNAGKSAIDLLARIGVVGKVVDKLQWSLVYNLTSGY